MCSGNYNPSVSDTIFDEYDNDKTNIDKILDDNPQESDRVEKEFKSNLKELETAVGNESITMGSFKTLELAHSNVYNRLKHFKGMIGLGGSINGSEGFLDSLKEGFRKIIKLIKEFFLYFYEIFTNRTKQLGKELAKATTKLKAKGLAINKDSYPKEANKLIFDISFTNPQWLVEGVKRVNDLLGKFEKGNGIFSQYLTKEKQGSVKDIETNFIKELIDVFHLKHITNGYYESPDDQYPNFSSVFANIDGPEAPSVVSANYGVTINHHKSNSNKEGLINKLEHTKVVMNDSTITQLVSELEKLYNKFKNIIPNPNKSIRDYEDFVKRAEYKAKSNNNSKNDIVILKMLQTSHKKYNTSFTAYFITFIKNNIKVIEYYTKG